MTRVCLPVALLVATLAAPAVAAAQEPVVVTVPGARFQYSNPNDARNTRQEFQRLLAEHPPALRIVLQADPSLLNRADYLTPYPRVAAFIKEHPEIARDPAFFLGPTGFLTTTLGRDLTPQERAMGMVEEMLMQLAVFIVVLAALAVAVSLIRQAIAHRRWLRQTRIQTDAHTKILDRLQSNEELLAYIQSPAGRRFLESGPSPESESPPLANSPVSRILWSVQAGVMLAALGAAMWIVQNGLTPEVAVIFRAIGVVALMLGLGAIVSAAASYVLSVRFGLLGASKGSQWAS